MGGWGGGVYMKMNRTHLKNVATAEPSLHKGHYKFYNCC